MKNGSVHGLRPKNTIHEGIPVKIHDLLPLLTIFLTGTTIIMTYLLRRRSLSTAFLLLVPATALIPVLASFAIFLPQTFPSLQQNFQFWLGGELIAVFATILFSIGFSRKEVLQEFRSQTLLLGLLGAGFLFALFEVFRDSEMIRLLVLPGPSVLLISSPDLSTLGFFQMGCILFALFQMAKTYISAEGVERWNIKYPLIGVFLWLLSILLVHANQVLTNGFERTFLYLEYLGLLALDALILYSLFIQRAKDVSLSVSRNAINRSLLLLLAGGGLVFLGGLSSTIKEFGPVWSELSASLMIFLGVASLVVVFTSERLRRELEHFLGVYFYSSRYDYRTAWMSLTRALSESRELKDLVPTLMERTREISFADTLVYCHTGEEASPRISVRQSTGCTPQTLPENGILPAPLLPLLLKGTPLHLSDPFPVETKDILEELFSSLCATWILPFVFRGKLIGFLGVGSKSTGPQGLSEDRLFLQALSVQWVSLLVNASLSREMAWNWETDLLSGLRAFTFHDLKNAGIALKLTLHNARENMNDPEFQEELLDNLQNISQQIDSSIEQFLYPFRQEYTRQTAFDLVPLVQATVKNLPWEKISDLKTEIMLPEQFFVLGNARALETTVRNLLINAREAMEGKGEIALRGTPAGEGLFTLSIRDNGPGMSQDFIDNNLFRPFQTTKKKGSGLGLYSSKLLIEQSGGQILVNSKEGAGTEFIILLPVAPGHGLTADAIDDLSREQK